MVERSAALERVVAWMKAWVHSSHEHRLLYLGTSNHQHAAELPPRELVHCRQLTGTRPARVQSAGSEKPWDLIVKRVAAVQAPRELRPGSAHAAALCVWVAA